MTGRKCQFVETWRCKVKARTWEGALREAEKVWLSVCATCMVAREMDAKLQQAHYQLAFTREARADAKAAQERRLEEQGKRAEEQRRRAAEREV